MSVVTSATEATNVELPEATNVELPETTSVELPDQVIVGILEPLSGANAFFGEMARWGIGIAVNQINEAGGIQSLGGLPIELVYKDALDAGWAAPTLHPS
jgi:branched-chain amino acid transport system substrate-binding protein